MLKIWYIIESKKIQFHIRGREVIGSHYFKGWKKIDPDRVNTILKVGELRSKQ